MSTARFDALSKTIDRTKNVFEERPSTDVFGKDVFNNRTMQSFLSKEAYKEIRSATINGTKISRNMADQVASAMKLWASSRGVTHYTHWFQPLTGNSAEKHDSFFEMDADGEAIDKFSGSALMQQEPDASSFPNGGLRNTFEARGYTAWDPTSPAFIYDNTLCIPTIFVSYTGEALDFKTPLLRAIQAIDKAATSVAKYFDKNVTKVIPTLGWEQEYFLIDEAFYKTRPDLILSGRTLLGHYAAKGQQLDDHYFGSIPSRVLNFMRELEDTCLRLGIPVKTRHNEVAPNQFELAPIFEEANLAVDHNTLLMDVMQKVARNHKFEVLLHEKPFANVNGSGKHNNWSLQTDTGENLLSPGSKPKTNLQFLTFFINTIKAVHDYADLMRASIMTAGNEHRLGANEAPPAIMSVFIGSYLTSVLDELESISEGKLSPQEMTDLKLNVVGKIPTVLLDNTDRNRTSPFAFTGNKFEFRAVGSSSNCGLPMMVLNTIMANQLEQFKTEVDAKIEDGLKKDDAILQVLRDYIKASKKIRFEGDGYGDQWKAEAEKRGLTNVPQSPIAYDAFIEPRTLELFEKMEVIHAKEMVARNEVRLEEYTMKIQIEGRILYDLAANHVISAAIRYQSVLIQSVRGLKDIYGEDFRQYAREQLRIIEAISLNIEKVKELSDKMVEARRNANKLDDARAMALAYNENVKAYFEDIRYHCDKLELLIDDDFWPLPKYREMLFTR